MINGAEAEPSPYANRTVRGGLRALNRDSALYTRRYLHYYPRMGGFDGAGTKIRRDSELAGRTFAAPFELAKREYPNTLYEMLPVDSPFRKRLRGRSSWHRMAVFRGPTPAVSAVRTSEFTFQRRA